MATLIPKMSNDWWDDYEHPFGISPLPETKHHARNCRRNYLQPWSNNWIDSLDAGSKLAMDKDKFNVIVDVQQFNPKEITVKTVDRHVVVEAKHEERPDEQGFVYRHFVRRYQLPDDVDPVEVASTLSSDGVLTIGAVRKSSQDVNMAERERVVPILHTKSS